MPAGNSDIPDRHGFPPSFEGTNGASTGPAGQSVHSNRPIPVAPRSKEEIPEAYDDYDEDEEVDELQAVLKNAPAWLVSTIFHMVLLIVVGMIAAGAQLKLIDAVIDTRPPENLSEIFAEQLGSQLTDPNALIDHADFDKLATEQMITPTDLAPVDDPLAAPPNLHLTDMNLAIGSGPGVASSDISAPMIGLALHGRQAGTRNVLLNRYGGTALTEDAVERGLAWLVKQQQSDGTWSLKGPYSNGALSENNAAATALALLAFQGHGDTHREGKHAKVVARAHQALAKMQQKDGAILGTMSEASQLFYTHALCTIAVCELYGMTHDSAYRGSAERAIAYLVANQDLTNGGWRYQTRVDSDTSVTGWVTMALESARMAGLQVPAETINRVSGYLDIAQLDEGRRYGYWRATQPSHATSAVGLVCRQYLGWKRDDPRLIDGVGRLVKTSIKYNAEFESRDVYFWYYAAQAAHHMEGSLWQEWNNVMRQEVPAHQVRQGAETGSWEPGSDKWGTYGGRLYVTSLSICMLEVYYRHLPIYSAGQFTPDAAPPAMPDKPAEPVEATSEPEPSDDNR